MRGISAVFAVPGPAASGGRLRTAPPVFVVGFQRSGTSLLRAMLNEHPELAVSSDSEFVPRFWDHRSRFAPGGHVDARQLVDRALSTPLIREWELPPDTVEARLERLHDPSFADAVRVVFESYADARGKPRWGDKTPLYVKHLPLLASLFPEARFVHVIRDGRDVAVSCLSHGLLADNVVGLADLWVDRVSAGRKAGQSLGPGRYLEVRYEALVADPTRVLGTVCDLIELTFDPEMLGYADRALFELPERVRYRHENLAKPPTPGLRDWRTEMSPRDVAAFEAVGGRLLEELGYDRAVARIPISARLQVRRRAARRWARRVGRRVRQSRRRT